MSSSEKDSSAPAAARLLTEAVVVVNVGLDGFVADLRANGVKVMHVDWAPPAGGDPQMAAILAKLGV